MVQIEGIDLALETYNEFLLQVLSNVIKMGGNVNLFKKSNSNTLLMRNRLETDCMFRWGKSSRNGNQLCNDRRTEEE